MVGMTGFEPATSPPQTAPSTADVHPETRTLYVRLLDFATHLLTKREIVCYPTNNMATTAIDEQKILVKIRALHILSEDTGATAGEKEAAKHGISRLMTTLRLAGFHYTMDEILGRHSHQPSYSSTYERSYNRRNRDVRKLQVKDILEIIRLYNDGLSAFDISVKVMVSHLRVATILKQAGFKLKRGRRPGPYQRKGGY